MLHACLCLSVIGLFCLCVESRNRIEKENENEYEMMDESYNDYDMQYYNYDYDNDAYYYNDDDEIVGGQYTDEHEYPSIVRINDFCGGSILSPIWILTAAHCVKHGEKVLVRAGEHVRSITENTEQHIYVMLFLFIFIFLI